MISKKAIVIIGASASGKTTFARMLSRSLECAIISTDSFYRGLDEGEGSVNVNFDDPGMIDKDFLLNSVMCSLRNEPYKVPSYDYYTHRRVGVATEINPGDYTIIEGIFSWLVLNDIECTSIYIDAKKETLLERRIRRDMAERGRERDDIIRQFEHDVWPMHEKHVAHLKERCDIIIDAINLSDLETISRNIIFN